MKGRIAPIPHPWMDNRSKSGRGPTNTLVSNVPIMAMGLRLRERESDRVRKPKPSTSATTNTARDRARPFTSSVVRDHDVDGSQTDRAYDTSGGSRSVNAVTSGSRTAEASNNRPKTHQVAARSGGRNAGASDRDDNQIYPIAHYTIGKTIGT
jgi:hypothetical protein